MHTSPRLGLDIPDGSDLESAYPADAAQALAVLDNSTLFEEGTISVRPAASSVEHGHIYHATDTAQWYISDGTNWNVWTPGARGAVNITTTGTRTNTAYGFLNDANDQVSGIVLPTNGKLIVSYQATWQESVAGAARAAIFIGANQLKVSPGDASAGTSPAVQEASTQAGTAAINLSLASSSRGLVSEVADFNNPYTGDVTTGQVIGVGSIGGSCEIIAAAGTYTVSVQFKASSGSVAASNRKLWVEAKSYG